MHSDLVCITNAKLSIPLLSPPNRAAVKKFVISPPPSSPSTLKIKRDFPWEKWEAKLRSFLGCWLSLTYTRNSNMVLLRYWCPLFSMSFHRENKDTINVTAYKSSCCKEEMAVKVSFSFTSVWPFSVSNHNTGHMCDRALLMKKPFFCLQNNFSSYLMGSLISRIQYF